MLVMGIESSCDETAIAVIKDGKKVLASSVYSQIETHKLFGGVVPEVAAREHLKVIDKLAKATLEEAKVTVDEIDAIAVTRGPGLVGALLVGISYAKGLAMALKKPLIPVNHVHAHVHGALLGVQANNEDIFPCLALVISGGHSNIYYMKNPTSYELMAYTIDDACGESFDKVAKLFDLGYPGGPRIEQLALKGDENSFKMPRMVEQKSKLYFSYSGLKTFMVNLKKKHAETIDDAMIADMCASFQKEALGQLVRKTKSVLTKKQVKSILVAGGVAANKKFKEYVSQDIDTPCFFPSLQYCSDNAAMIAGLGYYIGLEKGLDCSEFYNYGWDAFSRYDLSK